MPRAASSSRPGASSTANTRKLAHQPTPPPPTSRARAVPCSPGLASSAGGAGRPASQRRGPMHAMAVRQGPAAPATSATSAHRGSSPGGASGRAASLGQLPGADANGRLSSTASAVVPAYLMGASVGGSASRTSNASARMTPSAMMRTTMSANKTVTAKATSAGLRRTVTQFEKSIGVNESRADPVSSASTSPTTTTTYKVGQAVLNPFVAIAPAVQQSVRGVQATDALPEAARRPLTGAVLAPLHAEPLFPATPAGLDDLMRDRSGDATGLSLSEAERFAMDRLSPDAQEGMLSPVSMPVFTSTMLQHRSSISAAAAMATPAGALAASAAARSSPSGTSPWSFGAQGTTGGLSSATAPLSGLGPSPGRGRHTGPETVKLSTDLLWLRDPLHQAQEMMVGISPLSQVVPVAAQQRVDDAGVPLMCAEEVVLEAVPSSTSGTGDSKSHGGEVRGVGVLRGLYGTTAMDTTRIRSLRACVAGETSTTAVDVLPVLLRAESKSKELVAARRLVDWNAAIPSAQDMAPPVIAFLDPNGNPMAQRQRCQFVLNSATFELTEVADASTTPTTSTTAATATLSSTLSVGAKLVYEPSGKESDGGAGAIGQHRLCGLVGLVKGLAERVGIARVMEYQVRTANADLLLAPPRMVGADLVLRLNPSLQGTVVLQLVGYDCAHVSPTSGRVLDSANELTCTITTVYKGTQDGTAESAALATSAGPSNGTTETVQSALQRQSEASVEARELQHLKAQRSAVGVPSAAEREGGQRAADTPHFVFPVSNPYELRYPIMKESTRAILTEAYAAHLAERAKAEKARASSQPSLTPRPSEATVQDEGRCSIPGSLHSSLYKSGDDAPNDAPNGATSGSRSPHVDDDSLGSGVPSTQDGALEASFDAMAGTVPLFGATAAHLASDLPLATRPEKPSTAAARGTRRRVTLLFTGKRPEPPSGRAISPKSLQTDAVRAALQADGAAAASAATASGSGAAGIETQEVHALRQLSEDALTLVSRSGCLQSHAYCLRIAAWQDHITSLFGQDDKALFDSDSRAAFKRHARHELTDAVLSTLSVGRGGSTVLGRSITTTGGGSASGRRSITSPNSHSANGGMMNSEGAAAAAQSTSESSLALVRRLLLCLMSEDNRSSVQLYNDMLTLAAHLSTSALLRTTACTGGTPESLHRASTTALAAAGSAPSPFPPSTRLSEKDRHNLRLLVDALDVSMCAMFHAGCLKKAIAYGVQRVHALCVLEGCMNAVVAAAQRDIAELYLLFGDYRLAVQTAEEVLMIAEQLFDVDSNEVCGAETLLYLACHEGGYHDRQEAMRLRLTDTLERLTAAPTSALSFAVANNRRTLAAELHLVLCVGLSSLTFTGFAVAAAERTAGEARAAVAHLYDAVILLRGEGDLADMDKSFSTFANVGGAASADPFFRGEEGRQKRRRWSFLGLAAGMLLRLGEYVKGMAVFEALVEELVLGKHRYVERMHRAQIGALSWVNMAIWRTAHQPAEFAGNLVMLRRTVHRLTTAMGPLHSLSASANLSLAFLRRRSTAQISSIAKLALKSLSVMRSQLASRSNAVLMGYRVCNATCALDENRWLDLMDHANSALLIAQVNHASDAFLCLVEKEFLSTLLLCPSTALVRLNTELLHGRLEDRLERLSDAHGSQSEVLIDPLCNLTDACYLLGDLPQALEHIQRAVRLADPKGILFVSAAVLKPAVVLGSAADVARRDQLVHAVLASTVRVTRLAELLFALAAVLEASGNAADAQDCYARALALYEAVKLPSSLPAARIQAALAKLLYSSGEYGEALGWALACERTVHDRYGAWKSEVQRSRALVKTIEEQLAAKEGSYVMVNTNNTHLDYLELI